MTFFVPCVLVPWPNHLNSPPLACEAPQEPSADAGCTLDIAQALHMINTELAKLQPLKDEFQRVLRMALRESTAKSLLGCRLEVVGSSSWGGDVPQSDLDIVILTPSGQAVGSQAVHILNDLRSCLEGLYWSSSWQTANSSNHYGMPWQSVELLDTAYVPVLRLHCKNGFHCDVCVDQHHSVAHRDSLRNFAAARPEALKLVRLVKYCLHCRGLPLAAEGGIPSLAWSLIAFSFAFNAPSGLSIQDLFGSFLKEMQKLSDHDLHLQWSVAQDGSDVANKTSLLEWHHRGGSDIAWKEDWFQLISVDACQNMACAHGGSMPITPRSVSAGLALLYIIEFRLALRAFVEGDWSELWREPMYSRPSLNCMVDDGRLHVVLIHGEVYVGRICSVQFQPGLKRGDALHHRDQSCHWSLQEVVLRKDSQVHSAIHAKARKRTPMIWCQPCNWVCALPLGVCAEILPEGLFRLAEIFQVVGITRVSHDFCDTVLAWRQTCCLEAKLDDMVSSLKDTGLVDEIASTDTEKCNSEEVLIPSRDSSVHVQACEELALERTCNIADSEEDSTRASESDCEIPGASSSSTEWTQPSSPSMMRVEQCSHARGWKPSLKQIAPDVSDWKPSLRRATNVISAEHPTPKVVALPTWRQKCGELSEWKPTLRHRVTPSTTS